MTEAEYKALWKEGYELLKAGGLVVTLNTAMPYSFAGAASHGLPDYRTEYGFNEICVALALHHRKLVRVQAAGEFVR